MTGAGWPISRLFRLRGWGCRASLVLLAVSVFVPPCRVRSAPPDLPPSPLRVIPQPKSLVPGTGDLVWSHNSPWILQAPAPDARLWQAASEIFGSPNGTFITNAASDFRLQLGIPASATFPTGPHTPAWATNAEGYFLSVHTNQLRIQSATAQGAFYGLQTLAQLRSSGDNHFHCPAVVVADWPSLTFRGVHWFPSASGAAMDQRLIDHVFSAFKFNHCVIQCEAARWDSHPEIAMRNSISKPALRQLVAACRQRFLEPIPLVNLPGHAEWMFRHGQNTNLIEDPQTPYACCVRNPQTVAFLESVLTECLEVFHPQTFHLGFDEITLRGRFPNPDCPFCRAAPATTLMTESANHWADWLAARGVGTLIWGDMLLGPGEAADATSAKTTLEATGRRAGLAKTITIADWHYVWDADRRSLDALHQAGFPTIATTWSEPVNIYRFSQAALASGSGGLLQSTWAGFFPDERELTREINQFAAYILAADYAWSGRTNPPAQLGYDAQAVFLQAYAGASTNRLN